MADLSVIKETTGAVCQIRDYRLEKMTWSENTYLCGDGTWSVPTNYTGSGTLMVDCGDHLLVFSNSN